MAVTLEVVTQDERQVARPLHVLVPLIKADLQQGRDASERAGLPYYQAAGAKMSEAKLAFLGNHPRFRAWLKRQFDLSYEQAMRYMKVADETNCLARQTSSSLSEFIRQTSNPNYNKPHTVRPQAWHEPVKETLNRVDTDTLNLRRDEMKRADDREAQRKLALQLIDIGYKALATKLHPDKGGSRDAMARLNQVRDRLKVHA